MAVATAVDVAATVAVAAVVSAEAGVDVAVVATKAHHSLTRMLEGSAISRAFCFPANRF